MPITPALCQRCGACCSALVDGELIACRHLEVAHGLHRCRIYATRPPVCRDYDCMRTGQPAAAVADRVHAALQAIEAANQPAAAPAAA
ncbi:hypothetical protein [uncultured Luteimonas sp.]|uniref:hypothetical protein n=1 Tax=uncultured Luteimonas sp. TaxID=453144 RepID=UPI002621A02B|nr:hypothetical protein [uncultured Luteimonas sp.]